jgi:hypothetical protein
VAVGIVVNRDSPSHVASPVVVRLAAAVIVTACAAAFSAFFTARDDDFPCAMMLTPLTPRSGAPPCSE